MHGKLAGLICTKRSRMDRPTPPETSGRLRKAIEVLGLAFLSLVASCGGSGGGSEAGTSSGDGPTQASAYFPFASDAFWLYSSTEGPRKVVALGERSTPAGPAWVLQSEQPDGTRSESAYRGAADGVSYLATQDPDSRTRALGNFDILRVGAAGTEWQRYAVTFVNFDDFNRDGIRDTLVVRSTAQLVGVESIQTPAGGFSALLVRTTDTNSASLSGSGQEIVLTIVSEDWYAPDVGLVRNITTTSVDGRSVGRTESVLTGFRVGARRSDMTPPQVVQRLPAPGSVSARAVVRVEFDEAMDTRRADPATLLLSDPGGRPVQGILRWASDRVLEFQPAQPLTSGRHNIAVSAPASDIFGNAMSSADRWSFDIDATGPVLVGSAPSEAQIGVPRDARLTLRFDEPLSASSLGPTTVRLRDERGPIQVDVSVAGAEVRITPRQALDLGQRHVIAVEAGLQDLLGNSGQGFEVNFFSDDPRFVLSSTLPQTSFHRDTRIVDLTGDGRAEVLAVVVSQQDAAKNDLLLWRPAGVGLLPPERIPTAPGCATAAYAVADIDGDGRRDIVVSYAIGCASEWLRQDSAGGFTRAGEVGSGAYYDFEPVKIASTGQTALLVKDANGSAVVMRRQPNGSFVSTDVLAVAGEPIGDWVAVDTDGDGRQDVVALAGLRNGLQGFLVWRQTASGSFLAPTLLSSRPTGLPPAFSVVDVDGDGREDLLFVTQTPEGDDAVGWMLRLPDGRLGAAILLPTPPALFSVAAGDFNGDGLPDLVTGHLGFGHAMALHLRRPDGTYLPPELRGAAAMRGGDVAVADLSGDGRPDVLMRGALWIQRAQPAVSPRPKTFGAPHPLGERPGMTVVP